MNKVLVCTCGVLGLVMTACAGGESPQQDLSSISQGGHIVAKVGGEVITADDLDQAARAEMQRLEMRIYQIRKRVLGELIQQKLIAAAAAKEGLSVDAYLKAHIDDHLTQPTEEEVKAVYDERKGKDAQPFAKVKDQIAQYLQQNKRKRLEMELVERLRAESDVKIFMDVPRITVEIEDAPSLGPDDAPITLVEFADYECSFSRRARETVKKLLETYQGKIRYVFKDYPLSFHRDAHKAHQAARCAGDQGMYFEYSRMLFDRQDALSEKDLKRYAKEAGLDVQRFSSCLDNGMHAKHVEASIGHGNDAGVTSTPTYFINGILISNVPPIEAFSEIIDAEVERSK